jgi:hypothetical protein
MVPATLPIPQQNPSSHHETEVSERDTHERIRRRPVLGGLINEYEQTA